MGVDAVDGGLDELLLQMTELLNVLLRAGHLDLWLTGDHTKTGAWRIEQNAVKFVENLRQLAAIVGHDHCVIHSQTVQIGVQRLQPLLLGVVGNKASSVFHELCDVGSLSSRSSGHVKHTLAWLSCQGGDRQE